MDDGTVGELERVEEPPIDELKSGGVSAGPSSRSVSPMQRDTDCEKEKSATSSGCSSHDVSMKMSSKSGTGAFNKMELFLTHVKQIFGEKTQDSSLGKVGNLISNDEQVKQTESTEPSAKPEDVNVNEKEVLEALLHEFELPDDIPANVAEPIARNERSFRVLRSVVFSLLKDNKSLEARLETTKAERNDKSAEVEKLKSLCTSEIGNARSLKEEVQVIQTKYDRLTKEHQAVCSRNATLTEKLKTSVADKEIFKKFCHKLFEVFEISPESSLKEALQLSTQKENERKKMFTSFKALREENDVLQSEFKKAQEEIRHLKSQNEDLQMTCLAHEQKSLSIRRQMDKYNFIERISNEFINQVNTMCVSTLSIGTHVKRSKEEASWLKQEVMELKNQYGDLSSRHDIVCSLYEATQSRLSEVQLQFHSMIAEEFTLCDGVYSRASILKTKLDSYEGDRPHHFQKAKTDIGSEDNVMQVLELQARLNEQKRYASNAIKRHQEVIINLKKQLRQLNGEINKRSTGINDTCDPFISSENCRFPTFLRHTALTTSCNETSATIRTFAAGFEMEEQELHQMQISNLRLKSDLVSCRDDIVVLKKELVEKTKLIHGLLQTQAIRQCIMDSACSGNIQASNQSFTSIFDQLFSSTAHKDLTDISSLQEVNAKLKLALEETVLKNVILKENLTTLGCEIDRLNRERLRKTPDQA